MRKIVEWVMSLFFSKEAIALVKQEAMREAGAAVTEFENKKYVSKLKPKKRYTKVPTK
jgi:hypothetical protein